jgi:hypothetical protein
MVALAIPNIVIGAWAALAPKNWYDSFPSSGSPWISPDGPFNEHLTIDAGAGLLLLGVVLLGAAFVGRTARRVALIAALFHAVPHVRYHLAKPLPDGSAFDQVASAGLLVVQLVAMVALLIADREPVSASEPGPTIEGAVT